MLFFVYLSLFGMVPVGWELLLLGPDKGGERGTQCSLALLWDMEGGCVIGLCGRQLMLFDFV